MTTFWRVVTTIGRLLITFGVLVLLFTAYLLWGTNIAEAGHQSALRTQFDHALATRSKPARTTTSTTTPNPLVSQLTAGVAPGEGEPVAVIDIPKIGVDKVVVEGTAHPDLELGPGHYIGTPLPGQTGNVAIAGHRTTYGAPFYNLNELGNGDDIKITTLQGAFIYVVTGTAVVSPSDTSVLDPTTDATLTLTTCNPRFSAAQRLVVKASLVQPPVQAPKQAPAGTATRKSGELAGTQGAWGGAAAWGTGALALALLILALAKGRRRGRRWGLYAGSVLPMLVLLYFFFENVSPLLPASY